MTTTPPPYLEREFNDEVPEITREQGSSFAWDDVFGGWEDGKVFAVTEPEFKDYKEMIETDGKAANLELLLSYPIISASWTIDPAKAVDGMISTKSDRVSEFVNEALTSVPHQGGCRTPIDVLVSQMTSAFTHRQAYFEKVWKQNDDGKWVYDKIAWRPQETCELMLDDRTADVRGFRQYPVTWGPKPFVSKSGKEFVDIEPPYSFIYTHGLWRDPLFGFSSMQVPYWAFITKRKLRWLWYQFLDQTYLPKTIVQNQDEMKARADAKKVAQLRSKGVLGISSDTTVNAFESSGKGADGYLQAIRFLESEAANAIMGGFANLTDQSADGKGSYALAEGQTKLFLRNRRMVAQDMARQITTEVIAPLVRYNYGLKAPVPKFVFGPLGESTERDVLDLFRSVSTTGAQVDPEFYDELQVRVASLLELDTTKVKKAMEQADSTPGELNKMAQQVNIATQMVSGAQAQGSVPSSPVGPAPVQEDRETVRERNARRRAATQGQHSVVNGAKYNG